MGLFDFFKNKTNHPIEVVQKKPRSANVSALSSSGWGNTYSVIYDGEKNIGEIGPIKSYQIDFKSLSNRSWQSYLDSDIAKTVLNRFSIWAIDKGLKIQCSPDKSILRAEGINLDTEKFNTIVEARFNAWSRSKKSSHNGMQSFNQIAKKAFKNSKIGGDVLVVLRLVEGKTTVQLIDGRHVQSPFQSFDEKGHRIINGIEMDRNGRHIAYHVRSYKGTQMSSNVIPAWDKSTGLRKAFLVYGGEYRLDDHRGLPMIAVSLESIAKTDRYKEATVGSAEERAKIVYTIEHHIDGSGEDPNDPIAKMLSEDDDGTVPVDELGNAMANTVAASTNKQTFNMPQGAKMTSLDAKSELSFTEFHTTLGNVICGAMGIPPNVAFMLYTDSFSASRAAIKDWDHTLNFERDEFQTQFYDVIYAFWFHFEVLSMKIQAPGYLDSIRTKDWMLAEAFLKCKFTGPMFPHIDPVKEVKAARLRLGANADHIPLSTVESETENVGFGDSDSNLDQFSKETEMAYGLGIKSVQKENLETKDSDPE